MTYFNPQMVISPKASVEEGSVKVVYDGKEWQQDDPWAGWSVAELVWDGAPAVGIRWNGDGRGVGNPQSRGVPTWFILPDELAPVVLKHVQAQKAA
jgi:hypothetical protein